MRSGSIAKRYAIALLQVAQQEGKVQEYLKELVRIQEVLARETQLQGILGSPVVKPGKKKEILRALQSKLGASSPVTHLLFVLIDQDRVADLPVVVWTYRDMADEISGQVRVQVTAAGALGEQQKKLQAILERHFKKKVLLEVKVDPQILGGLVVQIQDQVLDGSLKRELQRVKESIAKQAVA